MHAIVELIIRCTHLIAAITWLGGIFFSLFIVFPVLKRGLCLVDAYQHMEAVCDRIRLVISIALHVLLVTGAMNFFIVGLNREMRFSRSYVILLAAKLGFVGVMTVFNSLHISVLGRKLEAGIAEADVIDSTVRPAIPHCDKQVRIFGLLTIVSGLIVVILALRMNRV